MANKEVFAVFAWRGDGGYSAQDAIGARYWMVRSAAERFADNCNADAAMMAIAPRGYVARSSTCFRTVGTVLAKGKIRIDEQAAA